MTTRKYIVYTGILALFATEMVFLSFHLPTLPWWLFWVMLPPATFRMARTISYNAIGAPLRAPFTITAPDGSGAGDSVNAKPGPFEALGELLACPICSGTHSAVVLVVAYSVWPALGLALALPLGAAGLSELFHWWAEAQEWAGRLAREEAGQFAKEREVFDEETQITLRLAQVAGVNQTSGPDGDGRVQGLSYPALRKPMDRAKRVAGIANR